MINARIWLAVFKNTSKHLIMYKLILITKLQNLTLTQMLIYIYAYIGVSGLRNTATTNATITITWDPTVSPSDCGPVLYYTLTATSLADASDRIIIVTSQTVAVFSSLMNGTLYNISVAAVNRAGSGPSSTIIVTGNAIGKYS